MGMGRRFLGFASRESNGRLLWSAECFSIDPLTILALEGSLDRDMLNIEHWPKIANSNMLLLLGTRKFSREGPRRQGSNHPSGNRLTNWARTWAAQAMLWRPEASAGSRHESIGSVYPNSLLPNIRISERPLHALALQICFKHRPTLRVLG